MLTEAFPKLNDSRAVLGLRAFLRSGWFIGVVVLLMACSELFSLELYVIYAYAVLGLVIVLLSEDTLPTVSFHAEDADGQRIFINPGQVVSITFGNLEIPVEH